LGFENSLGQIQEGFKADIIAVDTHFAHLHPISDPASHLVFSTQGLEVDTTIVAGKILMKDKKFLAKGFDTVLKLAQKQRAQVVKFFNSKR
jgi:5-methylthioadenosine/S-adenosylhomocysteine deaminase